MPQLQKEVYDPLPAEGHCTLSQPTDRRRTSNWSSHAQKGLQFPRLFELFCHMHITCLDTSTLAFENTHFIRVSMRH